MFTAKLKITNVSEPEKITAKDNKELTVRNVVATYEEVTLAFKVWNDLSTSEKLKEDNEIEVNFKVESKLYKDRYYTDLTILKIN